jgi:ATP-dependent helicase/nuclease subunit A
VLERAVKLLKEMDEFAHSRFRLESRFRHVLVDEFQDTSRAQWDLVAQLVRNWGEGLGAAADALAPSVFIVGDRKQSIYGFRDADVGVLDEAVSFIRGLRPEGDPWRAISVSFRSVPSLLGFVNDVFGAIGAAALTARPDGFRFRDTDRFPVAASNARTAPTGQSAISDAALGVIVGESVKQAAERVADEIVRVLSTVEVRDRTLGTRRPARPADVAILFRSRDSHREFERALERRGVSTYVYKGLGFFDADEVQDGGSWPIRFPICARRRCCGRGSSGCQTPESPGLRLTSLRPSSAPIRPMSSTRSATRTVKCWAASGTTSRDGWLKWTARRRGNC